MKRSTKKGFTIVELVIVIAIIAILAAVLIPTFASLIQKANESKDTQLVKNLNTALAADNKEHKTMTDALKAAEAFGYDVGKINASATGNEILWDSENDVFCYLKDGNVEYIPESNATKPADYKLWEIYDAKKTIPAVAEQKFSVYLADDANISDDGKVTVSVGFDAGTFSGLKAVEYNNTTSAQSVVIRTNSGFTNVTVNGKEGSGDSGTTVYHYGSAANVTVKSVGSASYHEFGSCANFSIEKGHAVIESTAVVLDIKSVSEGSTVTNNSGKVFKNTANVASVTPATAYVISSLEDLKAYRDYWNDGAQIDGLKVELAANITLDDGWAPIGVAARPWYGEFDGKGYTISNLNDKGYVSKDKIGTTESAGNTGVCYGLFAIIGGAAKTDNTESKEEVKIHDLTLNNVAIESDKYLAVGALVGADSAASKTEQNEKYAGNITIENITVNGTVKSTNTSGAAVGGIIGKIYTAGEFTVNKCTNNATVVSETEGDDKVGGVVGYAQYMTKLTVTDCVNAGTITANNRISGIVIFNHKDINESKSSYSFTINISNNENKGDLTLSGNGTDKGNRSAYIACYDMTAAVQAEVKKGTYSGNKNSGKLTFGDKCKYKVEHLITLDMNDGKEYNKAE